jgi:hypothetical protein
MSTPGMRVVESGPLRYILSEPKPRQGERPPLLCFLHGYDEAAPAKIERALMARGPLTKEAASVARERFVIVAPQLPRAGDLWPYYSSAVLEIVDTVQTACNTDPTRRYLTGFSFGGNGVFDVALAAPGRWSALWSVDPTRVPRAGPGLPVWVSIGEAARRRTAGFVQALSLLPALEKGTDPPGDRMFLDEGLDHVGSATSAYGGERIYEWMLRTTRSLSQE